MFVDLIFIIKFSILYIHFPLYFHYYGCTKLKKIIEKYSMHGDTYIHIYIYILKSHVVDSEYLFNMENSLYAYTHMIPFHFFYTIK